MVTKKIICGRAPLRLGLAGGGTDLNEVFEKYEGNVINTTINKYIYASVEKDTKTSLNGKELDDFTKLILDKLNVKNVKIISWREVPFGRGLGSSSAYSILLTKLISELFNLNLNDTEIVNKVYGIESQLGKCGWQDQYATIKGGFNWMEFKKEKTIFPLRINDNIKKLLESRLVLVYSGITHVSSMVHLTKSQMSERETNELKNIAFNTRNMLLSKGIKDFGIILNIGHNIKKNVSKQINDLYDKGIQLGASGGKVCGAGEGGYILFYILPQNMPKFREEIEKEYEILDFKFTDNGVETW